MVSHQLLTVDFWDQLQVKFEMNKGALGRALLRVLRFYLFIFGCHLELIQQCQGIQSRSIAKMKGRKAKQMLILRRLAAMSGLLTLT